MTDTTELSSKPSITRGVIIGGMVASMMMGMWEMVLEAALSDGTGFWSPLIFIGATIIRGAQDLSVAAGTLPVGADFDSFTNFISAVFGLMGHMMNSMLFGLMFAIVVSARRPAFVTQIMAGMAYGAMIFVVMWWVILPWIDPVMNSLNGLHETQRTCLLLRTVLELPYREIGKMLDIPNGTAMSHVHRARQQLVDQLRDTPAGATNARRAQ